MAVASRSWSSITSTRTGQACPNDGHNGVTVNVTLLTPGRRYNGAMTSRRRAQIACSTAVTLLGLAIGVAACGGSSPPKPTGSSGQPSFRKLTDDAYRFAACMRSHGVSNFPDPRVTDSDGSQRIAVQVVGPGTSAFRAARKACAGIMPQPNNNDQGSQASQQQEQDLLAFARCMRKHGFPKFPDPDAQGQLTLQDIANAGIDIHQPAVIPAADTCLPLTHGTLTRADVLQAVNGTPASGSQSSAAGG